MPTPPTHALIGISLFAMFRPYYGRIGQMPRSLLLIPAICACLPDMDLVVGALLGHPPFYLHHGISHSILFAVVSGITVGALWWRFDSTGCARKMGVCVLVSQTHWVLDMFSNAYITPIKPSIAPYWPVSDVAIHSGIALFEVAARDSTGHFQTSIIFEPYNLLMGLQEIAIAAAIAGACLAVGWWMGRRADTRGEYQRTITK